MEEVYSLSATPHPRMFYLSMKRAESDKCDVLLYDVRSPPSQCNRRIVEYERCMGDRIMEGHALKV